MAYLVSSTRDIWVSRIGKAGPCFVANGWWQMWRSERHHRNSRFLITRTLWRETTIIVSKCIKIVVSTSAVKLGHTTWTGDAKNTGNDFGDREIKKSKEENQQGLTTGRIDVYGVWYPYGVAWRNWCHAKGVGSMKIPVELAKSWQPHHIKAWQKYQLNTKHGRCSSALDYVRYDIEIAKVLKSIFMHYYRQWVWNSLKKKKT